MNLYVMRHGSAEDRAPSGRDFDRALTPAGRDRVRDVAQRLAAAGEAPRRILASPLVRAQQTAETLAAAIALEVPVDIRRELAAGASPAAIDELVRQLARDAERGVMLVGHEPDLSTYVEQVVGREAPVLPLGMLKAMVVGLSIVEGGPPRLRFVFDPTALSFATDDRSM